MQVELAEERVLVLQDRFSMDHAEGRASTKRSEAFGTLARITGLLSRPREEDYELVYRERRLQPFWRIAASAQFEYERRRDYRIPVDSGVETVMIEGAPREVANGAFSLSGVEHCRENTRREVLFDALSGLPDTGLAQYLKYDSVVADVDTLDSEAQGGAVVVPPTAKASSLMRDVLASAIPKFEADTVIEEKVTIECIDLCYRPVYAFRFRWQGKEAVVEFDGLTGEARPGGETFEQYLGKIIDPNFLLSVGVEAADIFLPGAKIAHMVIAKSAGAKTQ